MQITYPGFSFTVTKQSQKSRARRGELATPHGTVQTPAFIFCGTKAAIKVATPRQVKDAGTQIILANTYHLMLQPGADTVEKLGGLHKMMGWDGPMLTDSGGFQIFSLGHGGTVVGEIKGQLYNQNRKKSMMKIDEEGAVFRAYTNGDLFHLTPEKAIEIQRKLGPDFVVVLDECTPFHEGRDYTANSMRMSMRWGKRCLKQFEAHHNGKQAVYGISQGGVFHDLRQECAYVLNDLPFFGHAIGGSLGTSKMQMYETVEASLEVLDRSRPIHLLGIGGIDDVFEGIAQGTDTFDCVEPTRIARHGVALLYAEENNRINLMNARFKEDDTPLSEDIESEVMHFSRGYIHHLLKAKEMLGMQILAIHNIAFMNRLFADIRKAIDEDRFETFRRNFENNEISKAA